jgi:hypothetical protein
MFLRNTWIRRALLNAQNIGYRRSSIKPTGLLYRSFSLFICRWVQSRRYVGQAVSLPSTDQVQKFRERIFRERVYRKLASQRLTIEDVAIWSFILSGENPDDVAQRFTSAERPLPCFLLFEVLRRDLLKVSSLKMLLIYVQEHIIERLQEDQRCLYPIEAAIIDFVSAASPPLPQKFHIGIHELDQQAFESLVSRLLRHVRLLWPAAMVSVAQMITVYVHSRMKNLSDDAVKIRTRKYKRTCNLINKMITRLALPAKVEPLKSMTYNWEAQKVLLHLSGQLEPAVILNRSSYGAIIQVLNALKKSDDEIKAALLRSRSWPPWRFDQDGMDATRSPDDDMSRTISAILKSRESGHSGTTFERAMSVYGGRDLDGTPTIHTRKLYKQRGSEVSMALKTDDLEPELWAARIESTRDVREAWSAFKSFHKQGGAPNQKVYFAMLVKLNYDEARTRRQSYSHPGPGDGREVMPEIDDNFTTYYKERFHPPPLQELYEQMMASGLRPVGRCLNFLVEHAQSLGDGLRYLQDHGMDESTLAYLECGNRSQESSEVLDRVPIDLFTSYVTLLCRFSPRAIPLNPEDAHNSDLRNVLIWHDSEGRRWKIPEMQPPKKKIRHHSKLSFPLHHAAFLLKQKNPKYRPAWYALFKALARRGLLLGRYNGEFAENDRIAWKVLLAALGEFHAVGLELDPYGLRLVCLTFEKYARSCPTSVHKHRNPVLEASAILKVEFGKLVENVDNAHLPSLMHSVHGVHLHAYVRCMGLILDHEEILATLKWMVDCHKELQKQNEKSANGQKLFRRTLVSIKFFLSETDHEGIARDLVSQVEAWGGWPSDDEVVRYIEYDEYRDSNTNGILDPGEYNEDEDGFI